MTKEEAVEKLLQIQSQLHHPHAAHVQTLLNALQGVVSVYIADLQAEDDSTLSADKAHEQP